MLLPKTEWKQSKTEIAILERVIAGLPEDETKKDNISKRTKLEYKKFTLSGCKECYCVLALLDTKVDISFVEKDFAEFNAFITCVNERKNDL